MHLHILGICGTFMGGVAALARAAGHDVTGSDANVYPPMSTQLERLGVDVHEGYDDTVLSLAPDTVVIGNALSRGNPSVEAVLDSGLPYLSGPEWLARHVLKDRHVIAVAGTHGKTTTASMLAWILEFAGKAPGFLIGGVPENFGETARYGASEFFVVEADEYDTAFFDKRAKFVHYRPRTAVLNNLEFDHADIYKDLDAILWQFHQLIRSVPGNGRLIVNDADQQLKSLLRMGCWTATESFSHGGDGDWRAEFADEQERQIHFRHNGDEAAGHWQLSGSYNLENAIAATAAAQSAGVDLATAVAALAEFGGVKRRLEQTAAVSGIVIYDDFAHHPTAIRRTIEGMRRRFPTGRLIIALEARSNTMKLGAHDEKLGDALSGADSVVLYTPPELEGLVVAIRGVLQERLHAVTTYDQLVQDLRAMLQQGDHLIFMSNGGFGGVRQKLTQLLNRVQA
ncbi:MAG: UDP-N-acetylmuramate:L-alanyl-gamma-D-glutamyl-meso-diaminopimelate ligase [Woeseia sp.]|nr:UDP-N-acetylmuramate:L-alanyl-gamma-D-glutamyl-meso-diaminopimelate ligase [Woeseia sp.]MBT8095588.1 UDP-N-acetylmuramate:L-alanyl-gamma-D-glutamyl-meso-diaminopimelate ligase [Woeseia sp.]NNE61242.1 UDP-N-acetylmuramate:L-alanyl-gamma-D-glutamyl-meso-diaminopimelate ligase [Woeseia sp.]NNL53585.1 UDP-N-acetylmuramate:L-alanyl-gamma-D-glutamyl-meso-diaminopimelate ligase [Woeseia sp.]